MKHPYGYVANSIINDKKLSFNAKGIYLYILSKPDDWDFSQKRISEASITSEYSVRTALKELEDATLLERYKQQNGRVVYKIKDPVQEIIFEKTKNTTITNNSQKMNTQHADCQHADSGGISKKDTKVRKKESKKEIAEQSSATPFSIKEYIGKCYESKSEHVQIIGLYMDHRIKTLEKKVKTAEQARKVVQRHLKPAKELLAYTPEQIKEAMGEVEKKYSDVDWTLETISKHLTK